MFLFCLTVWLELNHRYQKYNRHMHTYCDLITYLSQVYSLTFMIVHSAAADPGKFSEIFAIVAKQCQAEPSEPILARIQD